MPRSSRIALFAATAILLGCSRQELGLPRIPLSLAAPDGRAVAEVHNHPSIDPPLQSLWLRYRSGDALELRRLAEDQEWCDFVIWAPDSSRVVFLVLGVEALLYDLDVQRLLTTDLVLRDGSYPPGTVARHLAFSVDGASLVFRPCNRRTGACGDPQTLPVPLAAASRLGQWRRVG